ncbi:MAG: AI-2E family transporter [Actinomycetota bacterium]
MSSRAADGNAGENDGVEADPRQRMPRWIPRLLVLIVVTLYLSYGAFQLLGKIRDLLVWILIAAFLSFALEPAANWLVNRGWRRGIATFAVLATLFVLGVVIISAMIPLVIRQVQDLIQSVPGWLDTISVTTERWFGLNVSSSRVLDELTNLDADVQDIATNVAGNVLGFGARALSAVFQMLTIALFTFYVVADGPRLRRTICSMLPPAHQKEVLRAWEIAVDKTGGYLYSRLLLAVISGVCTFVVLTALGVPFAVPLALWMGLISQFIPVVGTYIAAAVPLLVALLEDPVDAAIFLVFVLIYQQVENYLLNPRISARTMQLHPAIAFGSAIAGGMILGPIGAFLALPAAASIQAFGSAYVHRHEVVDSDLTKHDEPPRSAPGPRGDRNSSWIGVRVRRLWSRADREDSPAG